jgi:uncharacterized membrane protein YozB (DUF420 family)
MTPMTFPDLNTIFSALAFTMLLRAGWVLFWRWRGLS